MNALDRREPRHAARFKPVEEFRRRARVGAARVRVPDLRGEEFEEAIGGARAGGGDKGGRGRDDDADEPIYLRPSSDGRQIFSMASIATSTFLSTASSSPIHHIAASHF